MDKPMGVILLLTLAAWGIIVGYMIVILLEGKPSTWHLEVIHAFLLPACIGTLASGIYWGVKYVKEN